jgi:quinol monooxygenase YgiN
MFVIGMCWIALMPTFNVAAMEALPKWVRARGLANADVINQAGTAMGGIVWGTVATAASAPAALMVAAGGLAAGLLIAPLFPMRRDGVVDLGPAGHWPSVEGIPVSDIEAGPVLVTVEYHIDPSKREAFLTLAHAGRSTRRRDGAYAWGIYQDTEDPIRFIEEFWVASWSEHVRQHSRVTKYDQHQEALTRAFHIGPDRPRVRHFLYADLSR